MWKCSFDIYASFACSVDDKEQPRDNVVLNDLNKTRDIGMCAMFCDIAEQRERLFALRHSEAVCYDFQAWQCRNILDDVVNNIIHADWHRSLASHKILFSMMKKPSGSLCILSFQIRSSICQEGTCSLYARPPPTVEWRNALLSIELMSSHADVGCIGSMLN